MKRLGPLIAVVALVGGACGGNGSRNGESGDGTPVTVDVPVTLIGVLEISVEEGPVGDDGMSEVSFGSVTTDRGAVLIEVWADVARAAGLTRDELVSGGRYRVELGAESEYSPDPFASYVVTALRPDG